MESKKNMAEMNKNHIDAQKNSGCDNAIQKQAAQKTCSSFNINPCASNSIKKSTEEFLKNPELIEAYNNFCDSLVDRGYELRIAIEKTDAVFNALKNEDLYKE